MTRRLFAALLAVSVAVLVVFDVFVQDTARVAAERRAVIDIERNAFEMAILVQDNLEDPPGPAARRRIADWTTTAARRASSTIAVTDRTGSLVAVAPASRPRGLRQVLERQAIPGLGQSGGNASARTIRVADHDYEVIRVPIKSNRGIVGVVVIAKRSSVLSAAAAAQAKYFTPVLLLAIGLSALLALIVARAVVRPLGQLVRATRSIASEDSAPIVEVSGPKEIRELAEAFNAMSARVQTTLDRQAQFASDVSHQLRTPLTTIGTGMEFIRHRYLVGDVDSSLDTFVRVRDEVGRMKRLVEGLLVLSRVVDGEAEREPADVGSIARARADAWRDLAHEEHIEIEFDAPVPVRALVVEGAVEQILDNLIENAVEAAPRDSTIGIVVAAAGPDVIVTVSDTGPGLPVEDRERAFDRFWRGAASHGEGLGIGLTIVRDLARACGGDVRLEPGRHGGVTAVVRLESALDPDGPPDDGTKPSGVGSGTAMRLSRYLRLRAPGSARTVEHEVWREMGEPLPSAPVDEHAMDLLAYGTARRVTAQLPPDEHLDDLTDIERAFAALPPAEADVLALTVAAGLHPNETAQVVGTSIGRVRYLGWRGRSRLRHATSRSEVDEFLRRHADREETTVGGRTTGDERGAVPVAFGVPSWARHAPRSRRTVFAVSLVGLGSLALASVAAASGSLPDPVQHAMARAVSHLGISLPDPEPPSRPAPHGSGSGRGPGSHREPIAGNTDRNRGRSESGTASASASASTSVPVGSTSPITSVSGSSPTTAPGNGAANGNGNGNGAANGNGKANGVGNGNGAANGNGNGKANGVGNGNGNGNGNGKAKGLGATPPTT